MKRKSFSEYKPKELVLPMGEPGNCFENAMALVIAHPKRLRYVEGFYLGGDCTSAVMGGDIMRRIEVTAAHEASHCIAALVQDVAVQFLWVAGCDDGADDAIYEASGGDDSGGICCNSPVTDPWTDLVINVSGLAGERVYANRSAGSFTRLVSNSVDFKSAEKNAERVITRRGEQVTAKRVTGVMQEAYLTAFTMLTTHHQFIETLTGCLLLFGLVKGAEVRQWWDEYQSALLHRETLAAIEQGATA
jgi:hypothetical protein